MANLRLAHNDKWTSLPVALAHKGIRNGYSSMTRRQKEDLLTTIAMEAFARDITRYGERALTSPQRA